MLWGLYYGILLTLDLMFTRKIKEQLPGVINHVVAMLLVMFGWVMFYYTNAGDAFAHIGAMLGLRGLPLMDTVSLMTIKKYSVFPLIAYLASLPVAPMLRKQLDMRLDPGMAERIRVIGLSTVFALSVLFLIGQTYNPFIYFQF